LHLLHACLAKTGWHTTRSKGVGHVHAHDGVHAGLPWASFSRLLERSHSNGHTQQEQQQQQQQQQGDVCAGCAVAYTAGSARSPVIVRSKVEPWIWMANSMLVATFKPALVAGEKLVTALQPFATTAMLRWQLANSLHSCSASRRRTR